MDSPMPYTTEELAQLAEASRAARNRQDCGSIRMYGIQAMVEDEMHNMGKEELLGAHKVLGILSSRLNKIYFDDKVDFDRKALVKTIEELWEISCEIKMHKFPDTPSPPPTGK